MEEYNFIKSTSERYDIRLKDEYGWAIITIDENGGLFNAQSDYGNYNYSWPYHGRKSFKHFILELVRDKSYFLRKVADERYYYQEETEKAWKERIIEDRREGYLTQEQARELWNQIEDFDYYTSAERVENQCYENDAVCKYYNEPWESLEIVRGFSPQANMFADKIMPILGEIIKQEISNNDKKA